MSLFAHRRQRINQHRKEAHLTVGPGVNDCSLLDKQDRSALQAVSRKKMSVKCFPLLSSSVLGEIAVRAPFQENQIGILLLYRRQKEASIGSLDCSR